MTGLTSVTIAAARAAVAALARDMPETTAVAWVHSAALLSHATGLGLTGGTADGMQTGLQRLAASHPALGMLADPAVNPIWTQPLPVPHHHHLTELWRTHSIADPAYRPDGYLLGDLYQALSDAARRGRALCQTPRFVTSLLLELAVDRAADDAGGRGLKVCDPACGTGHILVETLLHLAGRNRTIGEALAGVHGVDIDPYAVMISRYRLLAIAARMNGARRPLCEVPADWPIQVAAADSLLDTTEPLLQRGTYDAIVTNPPYITVRDQATNSAIRAAWPEVCSGKYSLALPFFALSTVLARPGGWIAQLTSNSFMKREFGKKFVTSYLPRFDLRWVIDTSGAYIPGHGTPTVILVHRNQAPAGNTVAGVQGIRGEPRMPLDPAQGIVWQHIAAAVRHREATDRFLLKAHAARLQHEPEAHYRGGEI